jgi:hypothetical protein
MAYDDVEGDELDGDVMGFDVVGDELDGDDVVGVVKVNPRTGRKSIVRVPRQRAATNAIQVRKPSWRKDQIAPGVQRPDEGMVPLPLVGQAGATPGLFAVGLSQITFQGQLQKPYRAERLLTSTVRNTATAVGRLLGVLYVGTDREQTRGCPCLPDEWKRYHPFVRALNTRRDLVFPPRRFADLNRVRGCPLPGNSNNRFAASSGVYLHNADHVVAVQFVPNHVKTHDVAVQLVAFYVVVCHRSVLSSGINPR